MTLSSAIRLLVALGCVVVGSAPVQAVERDAAVQLPEQALPPSQAYRSITPRMTKKEVHKLMGKPSQSTDTLWIYTYADGTTVEVTFSQQRRVTQIINYQKRPKK